MKLASFHAGGKDRVGVAVSDSELVDTGFRDMLELIEQGEPALESIRQVLKNPVAKFSPLRWYAPVRRPSKIVCLALNNSANADRIIQGPPHPAAFIKGANALAGHGEPVVIKRGYGRVHPEPELAVVIGRKATEIRAADAYAHVFGYTIHNDITSPSMRAEDTFHFRAIHPGKAHAIEYVDTWTSYPGRYKGADTFSPMGPWLVTRDEIPDPHALTVACRHQGELVTEDSTANLTHKVPQVLEFLSQYMTLEPGDIVSMGTALRRGAPGTRAVQNVELDKLGGPVSVAIEGLGELENPVELRAGRQRAGGPAG